MNEYEKRAQKYLDEYKLEEVVNQCLNHCLLHEPDNPFLHLSNLFRQKAKIDDSFNRWTVKCYYQNTSSKKIEISFENLEREYHGHIYVQTKPLTVMQNAKVAFKHLEQIDPTDTTLISELITKIFSKEMKSFSFLTSVLAFKTSCRIQELPFVKGLQKLSDQTIDVPSIPKIFHVIPNIFEMNDQFMNIFISFEADSLDEELELVLKTLKRMNKLIEEHAQQANTGKNTFDVFIELLNNLKEEDFIFYLIFECNPNFIKDKNNKIETSVENLRLFFKDFTYLERVVGIIDPCQVNDAIALALLQEGVGTDSTEISSDQKDDVVEPFIIEQEIFFTVKMTQEVETAEADNCVVQFSEQRTLSSFQEVVSAVNTSKKSFSVRLSEGPSYETTVSVYMGVKTIFVDCADEFYIVEVYNELNDIERQIEEEY